MDQAAAATANELRKAIGTSNPVGSSNWADYELAIKRGDRGRLHRRAIRAGSDRKEVVFHARLSICVGWWGAFVVGGLLCL